MWCNLLNVVLVFQFLFATVSIAHGSPIQFKSKQSGYGDVHRKKAEGDGNQGTDRLIGKLTHLQEDPFQWEPVTESGFASRAPRATTPQDISDDRFEVKVRSTPVKIYKSEDDYLKDMQVDETRPKRKSSIKYGSILDPGPYQKPLSITLAPINSEYKQQTSSSYRPENEQLIPGHTASDAIKRVYHLEDGGFIPIVTNHGSAIDSAPVQRGITFTKLSQGSNLYANGNEGIDISSSEFRPKRKAAADHKETENPQHTASSKTFTENDKKVAQFIRGRRTRKGRKRPASSSKQILRATTSSQDFKPVVQKRNPKKFKPLNRNPRQQEIVSDADPLHLVTSNQIVHVSQEKDRKYHFEYTGESGVSRVEDGYIKNPDSEKPVQVMKGSYSYIGPDDKVYTITYIADENGYRATGSHLPIPP